MDTSSLNEFLEELFQQSGEIVRSYFFNRDYVIDQKSDDSPVTRADKEAEERIRNLIQKEFPHHGIIGEEFGEENEGAEYTWIIDPIDGTKAFITGSPLFTTLIGLLKDGEPIFGGIHQPVAGLRCIGDNHQTSLNGSIVRCRNTESISEATILSTSIVTPEQFQDGERFLALTKNAKLFRTWGDGYGYLLVAAGYADAMLDPIMNPWDVLPVIPVVRGSGAEIGNWQGTTEHWNSCIAASPTLFSDVIEALN